VVAAGRAYCDWETLFEAAQGRDWPLVVVCGSHDLERVRGLGSAVGTEVLVDVPDERARELLAGAAVSVLPMYDAGISHGQVRLCDAVDAGAAIVASAVRSLEGYVEDGRTAHLVPAGNAGALRAAVEELLRDPAARVALAEAAYERAGAWTWSDYLRAIEEICTRTS
jgi:glycosyltransferase involved in cell wall biosynthesis